MIFKHCDFFLGCLDDEANVDIKSVQRILQGIPANISLTFHRAFDVSQDPWKTTESIRSLGFKRILTSGQEKSAALGTVFENLAKKSHFTNSASVYFGKKNLSKINFQLQFLQFLAPKFKSISYGLNFCAKIAFMYDIDFKEIQRIFASKCNIQNILHNFGQFWREKSNI